MYGLHAYKVESFTPRNAAAWTASRKGSSGTSRLDAPSSTISTSIQWISPVLRSMKGRRSPPRRPDGYCVTIRPCSSTRAIGSSLGGSQQIRRPGRALCAEGSGQMSRSESNASQAVQRRRHRCAQAPRSASDSAFSSFVLRPESMSGNERFCFSLRSVFFISVFHWSNGERAGHSLVPAGLLPLTAVRLFTLACGRAPTERPICRSVGVDPRVAGEWHRLIARSGVQAGDGDRSLV